VAEPPVEIELDLRRCQLRIDGQIVGLEPRVFDLLHYLIERNDRVVSKRELLENVWPGAAVSDSALNRAVSRARKALRRQGGEELIQTVYGRGYRFNASAVVLPDRPSDTGFFA